MPPQSGAPHTSVGEDPVARSDLLVSLVRAGAAGDRKEVATAVEAIIAEERAKQHNILADRLTRALRSNGSGGRVAHPAATESAARVRDYVVEATPRKRIEDLVLSDVCERACRELVEEQHRASLLRSQSLEPRHRVLLVGPPGNGKTSVAEAIAEALAVSFFVVRYDAIIGSFLGETASRLRRVFDYARTTPCVLFFDEFDAVGKECGDVNETGEIKRVVTSLLMQVDDLPSYHRSRVSRRARVASRKARPGCLRGANSNASVRDSITYGQCWPPTRAGFRCATIRPASRPNARSSSRSRDR